MNTPAETVSAFFAHLRAARWATAVALIDPVEAEVWRAKRLASSFAVLQLRHDHPVPPDQRSFTHWRSASPEDAGGPDPQLVARWSDHPIDGLGVPNMGALTALLAPELLRRLLAYRFGDADRPVELPWFADRVEVLSVQHTGDNLARVTYSYRGQNPSVFDDATLRMLQRPWTLVAHRRADAWLLEVPTETLAPIPTRGL